MIYVSLRFNQFVQGMGYFRCPNTLLQDEQFKKILKLRVEECLWKHTPQPVPTTRTQDQVFDAGPTEILMEIESRIRNTTANYSRRKHLAETNDARNLREDIKIATEQLDANPLGDVALEAEIEYIKSALKNLEDKTASDECRANAVKAQFRAQKLKDRLNLRPPSKSMISKIITVHKVNGREIETKHRCKFRHR